MDTIELRPWVRLPGSGDLTVLGRPDPDTDWVSLLWTYARTRNPRALFRHLCPSPSPLFLEWAAAFQVGALQEAHACWEGQSDETEETRELARCLEVETEKLRRLVHLWALSGQRRSWPKPVRSWLSRGPNRARELAYLQRHGGPPERVRYVSNQVSEGATFKLHRSGATSEYTPAAQRSV